MGRFNSQFKGKLKAYFIKRLGAHEYKHGWLKLDCPFCGKNQKFGIHIGLNKSNCFVCGGHGSPLDVIMELENLDFHQAREYINNSNEFEGYEYKEERIELKTATEVYLPEGFKNISVGESTIAKSARAYIKKRGFSVESVSKKGWGYGTVGKYLGYLIIPFINKGTLTYYNARLFMGSGPRYNNPDTNITGLGKSFIWYNQDALYLYKKVYLCEGVFNAETIGDQAIASGGKFVSRYQINEIIKSPIKRIILCLDSDAIDKAIDLAYKLIDYKKVKLIIFPEGKDANDLGKKSTMKLIYSSRYLTKKDLNKLKLNL